MSFSGVRTNSTIPRSVSHPDDLASGSSSTNPLCQSSKCVRSQQARRRVRSDVSTIENDSHYYFEVRSVSNSDDLRVALGDHEAEDDVFTSSDESLPDDPTHADINNNNGRPEVIEGGHYPPINGLLDSIPEADDYSSPLQSTGSNSNSATPIPLSTSSSPEPDCNVVPPYVNPLCAVTKGKCIYVLPPLQNYMPRCSNTQIVIGMKELFLRREWTTYLSSTRPI